MNLNSGLALHFLAAALSMFTMANASPQGTGSIIAGTVWNDANGNNLQDGGEMGIDGVTINTVGPNGTVVSLATSGGGEYAFSGLVAGTYEVTVTDTGSLLAGFIQTGAMSGTRTLDLADAMVIGGLNFGYREPGGIISFLVFFDENENSLRDGGEVRFDGVNVILKTPDGETKQGITNTNLYPPDVSGVPPVFHNMFTGLDAGGYIIETPNTIMPGFIPSMLPSIPVSLSENQVVEVAIGYKHSGTSIVRVKVRKLPNFSPPPIPVSGITVYLTKAPLISGPGPVMIGKTNSEGYCDFTELKGGRHYTASVDENLSLELNGWTCDNHPNPSGAAYTFQVQEGDYVNTPNNVSFDYVDAGIAAISGVVWHDGNGNGIRESEEQGLGGIPISVENSKSGEAEEITTSADGSYRFSGNLFAGDYVISAPNAIVPGLLPGTPNSIPLTVTEGQSITKSFGYFDPASSSIKGEAWYDADGNGLKNGGEAGFSGVTVALFSAQSAGAPPALQSQVTNVDGSYSFQALVAGDYTAAHQDL